MKLDRHRRPLLAVAALVAVLISGAVALAAEPYHDLLTPTSPWKQPIPASPVIDPNSAAMVNALTPGDHVVDLKEFGVPVYVAGSGTPEYNIRPSMTGSWGANPFGPYNPIPIPSSSKPAPGSDAWLVVVDPVKSRVYELWQARRTATGWTCTWGAVYPFPGSGTHDDELQPYGNGNGAGVNVAAGLIRRDESIDIGNASMADVVSGVVGIRHALSFSSTQINGNFRYPASKADHSLGPVPAGTRIQLDPTVSLSELASSGATKGEVAVAKALQTYGAYLYDTGGATVAFAAEGQTEQSVWDRLGWTYDYPGMTHIPWSRVRVLRTWDGS